jgi:hypothetical protein
MYKPNCCCGHIKEEHYNGLGKCAGRVTRDGGKHLDYGFCFCSRYAPLRNRELTKP